MSPIAHFRYISVLVMDHSQECDVACLVSADVGVSCRIGIEEDFQAKLHSDNATLSH